MQHEIILDVVATQDELEVTSPNLPDLTIVADEESVDGFDTAWPHLSKTISWMIANIDLPIPHVIDPKDIENIKKQFWEEYGDGPKDNEPFLLERQFPISLHILH